MSMLAACEDAYAALLDGGCVADVAAMRVYDALESAWDGGRHVIDQRDRLLENRLRTIRETEQA